MKAPGIPLLALAAALLAACSGSGGGRDEPTPPLPRFEALAEVRTLWSRDAGSGYGELAPALVPAVDGARVFAADEDGRVHAFDAESGRPQWSADVDAAITGGVGAGGGLVLAGTDEGEVIALAADTGESVWRARVSSEVLSSPRHAGETVVVRTLDGKLAGLDAGSGEPRWVHDADTPGLSLRGTAPPSAVVAGIVVAGFDDGRLAAVRAATGEVLWEAAVSDARGRSELDRLVDVDTEPVIEGRVAYASSYRREVAAFEAATGREVWRRELASLSGLAVDPNLLYLAAADGTVHALDRLSGRTVWTNGDLAGRAPVRPVVHGPFVVFADLEGYLHWFRREDGRLAASADGPGSEPPGGRPAVHGQALVVYGARGRLTALAFE